MSEQIDSTKEKLETIALEVVSMEGEDIPTMGNIFNLLCEIETDADRFDAAPFSNLLAGLKIYLEKVVLRETDDFAPFEEGLAHLQSAFRCVENQSEYKEDISEILERLGLAPGAVAEPDSAEPEEFPVAAEADDTIEDVPGDAAPASPDDVPEEEIISAEEHYDAPDSDLGEEDLEILNGFVFESIENLDTVEVSLINLEQDPNDAESINAIFRSFHTIKGVSSFIGLMRINKLAHRAENLLDKVRDGEIAVQENVIDIILETVDMLKQLIEGVQKGMENGTTLDIGLGIADLVERIDAIQDQAAEIGTKPVGEILVERGDVTREAVEQGLARQKETPGKKLGEILVEEKSAAPKKVVSALRDQKKFGSRHVDLTVKVDTQKLDNLVDLTGELVIAQSMLRQHNIILSASDQGLAHNLGQLTQITSSLQTTAMSMRMVPIKSTFQKMLRLVRDLAKNSNKEVQLRMSGEDTEIDRNVVDELYEPMVHMIRNSCDHGIEAPDQRESAGKPRKGEIFLHAYHQGGNIIVEITDDGKGLDRDRIIEKAKANNLISDDSKLTDAEIYNLIFQPGCSTAKEVTDISGRGVGMDVVKKAIEKLRGRVEINSRPGQGSTFIISLPLTLAIIEGMLVRVGSERYVIPALAIVESFRPTEDQYSTVEGKGEMILTRGRLLPLVRLNRIFEIDSDSNAPWEGLVVTVEYENHQICLLLDELLGKEEVVIKSLGDALKNTIGIAGGAIMGDGRVGLILDIAGIWSIVRNS